ncbi:unnamed protein product [Effrenium voratum]|nr:unnamed protein product [Effrenium voratum]
MRLARLARLAHLALALAPAAAWPSDPPSFPQFPGRQVSVLNGTWDFAFLGDVALEEISQDAEWQKVSVPDAFDLRGFTCRCEPCSCCDRSMGHRGRAECWGDRREMVGGVWVYEEHPEAQFEACCQPEPLYLKRGVAMYRTQLDTLGTAALLLFGGCTLRCVVMVDGVVLEDHAGLSPFQVEVPAGGGESGARTLLVIVDNRFGETHPVHQPKYDWYQAGGIIRPVQFHELPSKEPLYISYVHVYPRSLATVDVKLKTSGPLDGISLRWRLDDESGCQESLAWPEMAPEGAAGLRVPDAEPWSPSSPSLRRLSVAMLRDTQVLDCICVRFGLRRVEAQGHQILLNQKPVKLLGFNRHDMIDSPVMTYDELVADVEILKELGANFVRGAHYAQDQRFLDLCDVYGLLVWEEVLGWQNTASDFENTLFMAQSMRMATELALASGNHPSVILLGFFNEGESFDQSEATTVAYHAMAQHLRRHTGNTRLIGYGSNHAGQDQQLNAVDVYAFHLYLAWYPTTQPADAEDVEGIPGIWDQVRQWSLQAGEKPMLITEAGAGGLFGHHTDGKWSEEYQARVLRSHLEAAIHNPQIAGIALWQFADIPIDRSVSDEQHRPRGLNNKGVLSMHRKPKLAASVVSQLLHEHR